MDLLKELWNINETTQSSKKTKKTKKDKSAAKYLDYVAGNMVMKGVCSGKLSGDKNS